MANTSIEWTEKTWNPTTGCTKISEGCKNCYAEIMTRRLKAMGQVKYKDGFKVRTHEDALLIPYSWKKPSRVFVNSMSDLFHEDISLEYIQKVFKVMNENNIHTFQVLTKRAERLYEFKDKLNWTENIWIGVTVENSNYRGRINFLREVGAKIRFLSLEPLIGDIGELNLQNIDWVIVGGESGHNSRLIREEWVTNIHNQCIKAKVPFFFKQWGGWNKKLSGRLLNGHIYSEMPI